MSRWKVWQDTARAAAGTTVALWTVDVLVNLDLPGRFLAGRRFHASMTDYLGLFVAEFQVALIVLAGALLWKAGLRLVARWIPAVDGRMAWPLAWSVAVGLPFFSAQAHILWDLPPTRPASIAMAAVLPAGIAAALTGWAFHRSAPPPGAAARAFLLPLWAVASANLALWAGLDGDSRVWAAGAGSGLIAAAWLASLLAGVVSALLGVGGGVIKVPIMVLVLGLPVKVAVATSKLMVGITAAAGLLGYAAAGELSPCLGAALLAGTYTGALLASRVLAAMRPRRVAAIAATYYTVRGLYLVYTAAGAG